MRGNRLFKALDAWVGIPLVWALGLLRSRAQPSPLGPGSRVLLIKQSAMGDTLLLLPLLKALREQVGPQGAVDLLCTSVNAGALKDLPWLDQRHRFEPARFLAGPWRLWRFLRGLRARRYDWALDMDQWLRSSALLALASGAAWRAGFSTPGQHKHGLFHRSAPNHRRSHEFEQFKDVAALAGLDLGRVGPFAGFLMRSAFLGAAPAARQGQPWVLLHPGARVAHRALRRTGALVQGARRAGDPERRWGL
jgi:heptosyltransferase III